MRRAARLRNPLRHQLPVRSPLSAFGVVRALGSVPRRDLRPWLRELLLREFRADAAVLCGSGTQALQLAIRAAAAPGEQPFVALPAFSCFDVATAAVGADARIAFYDLDPRTLAPDLASLEQALHAGVRVVVASPLYGIPIPWKAAHELAEAHGATLVEDAAQGHGAAWTDQPLGGLGEISVLSFGRGKGWTGGGGGVVLFRGGAAERARADRVPQPTNSGDVRVLVASLAQAVLGRPSMYGLPASVPWLGLGETRYHQPAEPGGMTRASAALLADSRAAARREAEVRRRNAEELLRRIGWRDGLQPVRPPEGSTPGYLRLPVLAAGGMAGFDSPAAARRLGIAASYPIPLPHLAEIRERIVGGARRWPGAERLAAELITLPTHGGVTPEERRAIVDLLNEYPT